MNVRALQRVDRWLGIPVCFLLTLARRVLDGLSSQRPRPPQSLVIVKLSEQGSTVLAYAALKRAVEMVGREHVHFVVFEQNRFILDVLGVIPEGNVITISTESLGSCLWSTLQAIRQLRRLKVSSAIDLDFFSRGSAALVYLSGAVQRVGFHAFFGAGLYRGDLMTHRLMYNPHLHTSQTFLMLVEALRCDPVTLPTFNLVLPTLVDEPPQFVASPEDVAAVERMLGWRAGERHPLVLLNPNCSDLLPLRRWPSERYVELARRLLAKYPEMVVAFTGSLEEVQATGELVQQVASDRGRSLAGATTLRQLLALYSLAGVLVTNDSGPAHFATLTPVRIVTLFGPETPELFGARTSRNTVLWARIACSPCVSAYNNRQSNCRDNVCMQALTLNEVLEGCCRGFEAGQAEQNN